MHVHWFLTLHISLGHWHVISLWPWLFCYQSSQTNVKKAGSLCLWLSPFSEAVDSWSCGLWPWFHPNLDIVALFHSLLRNIFFVHFVLLPACGRRVAGFVVLEFSWHYLKPLLLVLPCVQVRLQPSRVDSCLSGFSFLSLLLQEISLFSPNSLK